VKERSQHKAEGGKVGKGGEYAEEICPYATFQISKPPYQESTYSGNVYSGPYSSVKGSFVYHDSKQNPDVYKLKSVRKYLTNLGIMLKIFYSRPHTINNIVNIRRIDNIMIVCCRVLTYWQKYWRFSWKLETISSILGA